MLALRNGVVRIEPGAPGSADAGLRMSFDTWAKLVGREAKALALVEQGEIQLDGDSGLAKTVLAVGGPLQ